MKVKTLKETLPPGFSDPTALPENEVQQDTWQKRNQHWWQSHPMRYDFSDALASQEFSPEFYNEIDRRFFESAWHYAPWKQIPFDSLIDFPALRNKAVLEIGCGNGSHAQLLATHAGAYTGIDLTDYAVRSTTTRLSLRGIGGTVLQMDAEKMKFPDNSFDFIWSWGVIHHSANTAAIISEMRRVLSPRPLEFLHGRSGGHRPARRMADPPRHPRKHATDHGRCFGAILQPGRLAPARWGGIPGGRHPNPRSEGHPCVFAARKGEEHRPSPSA
jgi:ubiquinone/menaquinone biosynthesis C-methylase UbiE